MQPLSFQKAGDVVRAVAVAGCEGDCQAKAAQWHPQKTLRAVLAGGLPTGVDRARRLGLHVDALTDLDVGGGRGTLRHSGIGLNSLGCHGSLLCYSATVGVASAWNGTSLHRWARAHIVRITVVGYLSCGCGRGGWG